MGKQQNKEARTKKIAKKEKKMEKRLDEVLLNEPSQKLKEVMKNGKMRHRKRMNDGLSVVGSARNKFRNGEFELDALGNEEDMLDSWTTIPSTSIVLICSMVFSAIGLFVMCSRKQSGYRYSKVNLRDEEDESTD